jgi:hypothetical protein
MGGAGLEAAANRRLSSAEDSTADARPRNAAQVQERNAAVAQVVR